MCGRYFRRSDKRRIAEAFHLGIFENLPLEAAALLQHRANQHAACHPQPPRHGRARNGSEVRCELGSRRQFDSCRLHHT
jgi:hypothetical protein